MKQFLLKQLRGDKVIWMIILLLFIVSALAVYSSTGTLAYKYQGGNVFHYIVKHLNLMLVGVVIIFIVHRLKYELYFKIANIFFIITIPLLAFTLLMGSNINSASRWLTIPGIGLTFQTSDFAKLSLVMMLAKLLSKHKENPADFKKVLLPAVGMLGLVCVLILPANFSTSALLFVAGVVMLFLGRIPVKQMLAFMGVMLVIGGLFVTLIFVAPGLLPRGRTWKARIENFSSKEANEDGNFQADQAKIAVVNGGIIGMGPGKSTQRNFLPHPYSDFIYAIIVEEYGLIGGMFVMGLYLFLLFRAGAIVRRAEYLFPALLAVGITFLLVFQAMVNMAVAVNLIPVTGQTLPFVSMGGTSVFLTSFSLGIVLNISITTAALPEPAKPQSAVEAGLQEERRDECDSGNESNN